MVYCYRIIKENVVNGNQTGNPAIYYSDHPLTVGGLYMHLRDLKGAYRVLSDLGKLEEE